MVIIRKLVLLMVLTLLRIVNRLLAWVEQPPAVTHADEPILVGDPGCQYVPPAPPMLRLLPGGRNTDSDSCPRNDVPSDERASDDHPVTPGGFRS